MLYAVRCAMHLGRVSHLSHMMRYRSIPKFQEVLKYYYGVKQGKISPGARSLDAKAYWDQVLNAETSPFSKSTPARMSWNIDAGLSKFLRKNVMNLYIEKGDIFEATDAIFTKRLQNRPIHHHLKYFERELANKCLQYSLSDLVYFMDYFLVENHPPKALLSKTLSLYTMQLDPESVKPATLIHLITLAGLSRNAPLNFMRKVEQHLLVRVDCLSMREISLIAFAFNSTNTPLVSHDFLSRLCARCLSLFEDKTAQHKMGSIFMLNFILNIMKVLLLSKYSEANFYQRMALHIVKLLEQLDVVEVRAPVCSHLLRIYTTVGVVDVELFRKLAEKLGISQIYQVFQNILALRFLPLMFLEHTKE